MKLLIATILTVLSFGAFAQTLNGIDEYGNQCSIEIFKQSADSIIVKMRGENLKKKLTLNFSETQGYYHKEMTSDYGNFGGFDIGQIEFATIRLEQKSFTYYRSEFLFQSGIEVNCDLID